MAAEDSKRAASSSGIEESLRATLRMLGTITRDGTATADDMRKVLSTRVTRQQVRDALTVCTAFNITDRLADASPSPSKSSPPQPSTQEPSTCRSAATISSPNHNPTATAPPIDPAKSNSHAP
ncbi:hypothetical protein [Nocardia aurantiaca]|uniref:Uncharacterized protein n=1 Tax=Nocardia aurantiaca TaxID=2675850 RepID=A0A6I3KVD9_9NOCA|nr:hypothetical protein [Nocardia aurantiaca]MTE13942.1 hypothetical protein [Nocardia aurantiaca]